jgi:hypothetical protein
MHNTVGEERAPGVELQDPRRSATGLPSAQAVNREGIARNGGDGSRREEGSCYLLPSVGVELTDVEPEVVPRPVPPDLPAVVL